MPPKKSAAPANVTQGDLFAPPVEEGVNVSVPETETETETSTVPKELTPVVLTPSDKIAQALDHAAAIAIDKNDSSIFNVMVHDLRDSNEVRASDDLKRVISLKVDAIYDALMDIARPSPGMCHLLIGYQNLKSEKEFLTAMQSLHNKLMECPEQNYPLLLAVAAELTKDPQRRAACLYDLDYVRQNKDVPLTAADYRFFIGTNQLRLKYIKDTSAEYKEVF